MKQYVGNPVRCYFLDIIHIFVYSGVYGGLRAPSLSTSPTCPIHYRDQFITDASRCNVKWYRVIPFPTEIHPRSLRISPHIDNVACTLLCISNALNRKHDAIMFGLRFCTIKREILIESFFLT
ncbi:hypothetical protein CEXT_515601 [Caerostris extrusa]|uniref:Uncharacterized protein n=1 Tax=Caerostris extrusa TaxID=172846 RepID=A0AAV4P131_CAEEX|nr:hypothetical protein CEXT_515601 [Caerostris extrusa]